jgi:hypothetical protein
MEKSLSSVLHACVVRLLAPCVLGLLTFALSGCGGAASPSGSVSPKSLEPSSSKSSWVKRHLTPELVAPLPASFVESHNEEGEALWFDRGTGFGVRGIVFPVPFGPLSAEMRKKLTRDDPDVRIEDKSRGKEHALEFNVRQPAHLRQIFLTLAQVSDGKRSAVVSCGGLLASVRATCKESIDSVWFAPDERTPPKAAPHGKRWLDLRGVHLLVPEQFQPDAEAQGIGVKLGENRIYFWVVDKAERVSLSDALRKKMNTEATALGAETPLKRSVGFGSSLEAVHAVQVGEPAIVVSRLFPVSADSTAIAVCSAPERAFRAQPKLCAALLDTLEVVTPTPLVNARVEGGSSVR